MGRKVGRKYGKQTKTFQERTPAVNWKEQVRENETWETYYKLMNLIPENEWDEFKKACQSDLPTTFRITGLSIHAEEVRNMFTQTYLPTLKGQFHDGELLEPFPLEFYPEGLGYGINVLKGVVRKNPEFGKTQRFLVLETDVGNISRQEAVLMIPPLLMDIKPHHAVLDMCAAPGSKTAQLVEALHADNATANPTGFVIANDLDYRRLHLLVHQVKRLNLPNFMVVNHDASMFPRIRAEGSGSDEFVRFDRILCDVPCSGDGTMRKNVNVWKDFKVGNALGLHDLQVRILERGLNLLKKGGRLVYSTCSLLPVENEAVVAAALRQWGDSIKLVDVSEDLPGLKRAPGVSSWKVFGKDMELREPGAEDVLASVFPPTEEEAKDFHLERCVRVYPHLQNTGGFFITVFEKVDYTLSEKKRDMPVSKAKSAKKLKTTTGEAKEQESPEVKEKKVKLPRNANEEPFNFLDVDTTDLATCWPFYNISDDFPRDCCLVRNATGEAIRNVYQVSPSIRLIMKSPEMKLKMIHAGIRLFVTQRTEGGECTWRVQNESLRTMKPFLGEDRQVECSLDLLKYLIQEAYPKLESIKEMGGNDEFINKLTPLAEGCTFLTVKRGENLEDLYLPLWKGKKTVNLMVNKVDSQELMLRVFGIETDPKELGKETRYQNRIEAAKKGKEYQAQKDKAKAEAEAEEAKPAEENEESK